MSIVEKRRLQRVLGKFSKNELPKKFEQMGLNSSSIELKRRNMTKRELVSCLVDSCIQANVSSSDILMLELNYAVAHYNSLLWRSYQLERLYPTRTSVAELDSQIFSKRLQLYLGDICNFEMVDDLSASGHHWLCLHINDGRLQSYTCYVLRSPSTPFFYLAGVKKTHLTSLLEALCLTLECKAWVDLMLSGKNLDSLLELTMNKDCQGPNAKYRLNPVDCSPLISVAKRRCCQNLMKTERHQEGEGKRIEAVEEAFGTNSLPKLNKFLFKLHVDVPGGTDSFHCKLKLTGSNVLEGVKECFVSNSASLPVPESFRCMAQCSTNVVSIVETSGKDQTKDSYEHNENEL